MGGRLPSESVAGLRRNQWPLCVGLRTERNCVIDSPPIPRARPGDGRHDQLGNFQTALLGRITPASTAAARLRHIAGTAWSTKRYLNIELLKDQQMRGATTA